MTLFFFSSRRRHTRYWRDWSSDVCSSDLIAPFRLNPDLIVTVEATPDTTIALTTGTKVMVAEGVEAVVAAIHDWRAGILAGARSEERRVGKECRSRWSQNHLKKKNSFY